MTQPASIDLSAVQWEGEAAEPQLARQYKAADEARANAARADAAAATRIAQEKADRDRREWEATHNPDGSPKVVAGKALREGDHTRIAKMGDNLSTMQSLLQSFNPDFAGNTLTGGLENTLQSAYSGFGTPNQRDWWSEFSNLDNIVRNGLFGASLTPGEKREFEKTTVTPSMDPKIIQQNLARRAKVLQQAAAREFKSLSAAGWNKDEMDALIGAQLEWKAPDASKLPQREEDRTVNVFAKTPEGTSIGGQSIKGFRFTPVQEDALVTGLRSGKLDANAFAAQAADFAIQNGTIRPEQRDDFAAQMVAAAAPVAATEPERRAGAALDYSAVDKAAMENAGLGTALGTALSNVPESAANLATGVLSPLTDTLASVLTGDRVGTVKTFTDLASEVAGAALGETDTPTIDALTQAMKDRYGSVEALKRAAIEDPVGIAGDLSLVLTGGGSAVARTGAALGSTGMEAAGRGLRVAGRAIDPLSAGVALVENAPRAIPQGARNTAIDAVSELIAAPSGVGGQSLREGAAAGFERGRTGAPTPRSQGFTTSMRDPGSTADDIVTQAREAIGNLRQAASQRYQAAMSRFGRQPQPLDITRVQQRIAAMRPRNYTAMVNAPNRPSNHVAWEQLRDTVNHYADQATQDPSLLMPLQMDAFKQDLYDVGSRIGGAYDRDAARMAREAYDGVRRELIQHDPVYADTMADYERAAREAQQLEGTFGLAAARGKQVNIDSAARKLQSIMRNNANTNYGRRTVQGERLNELSPDGALMANLAGQSASSWTPRGVRVATAPLAPAAVAASGIGMTPAALMAAAASPRAMGELSYGAGLAAGTVARGVDAAMSSRIGQTGQDLSRRAYDLYQKYPTAALGLSAAGARAEETEAERFRREYGIEIPEGY